ncbi:MAG: alpha-ketoacid dehydrogenase subunit beta [Calditrichaeota bacterium]|nr:alpha-ketoacid dehydrogenase subunit beta [Calditrichota bacterium]
MSSNNRKLQYSLAINEALKQKMALDESVFLIGQGVKSPWYVGNTAKDLLELYGNARVIDTPVSENAMTGAAVGAAIVGMRPIVVHPRMDFMLYAFDPIINQAANWSYMSGGKSNVPVVIWGIVNRGGEQAAQHSQALHGLFNHIPGLKIVMPATPYDAKGLMVAAIEDDNPVIYIDDRWLYEVEEDVPEESFTIPIGKAAVRKLGNDVTIIGISYMAHLTLLLANELENDNIHCAVIDVRTLKPLDIETIFESVKKTGRVVVTDVGWLTGGVAGDISAVITENCFKYLKAPVMRVTLPDCPAPSSGVLEEAYYPTKDDIKRVINQVIHYK